MKDQMIRHSIERELTRIDHQLQLSHTGANYMVIVVGQDGIRRTNATRAGERGWHPIQLIDADLLGLTLYTEETGQMVADEVGCAIVIHWREFLMERQKSLTETLKHV